MGIRDAWTGRKLRDLFIPEPLFSAAWSPDGRTIAAGCKGFHVHLWDVEAGTELRTLVGHRAEVTRLGFHSSGRVLFSSGWDGVLLAWRVEDGAPLFSTRGELAGIARRGDGLAVRRGMQVDLYRVVTGREFRVLRGHDPAVKRMGTVEFTPDGRWVISAGRDAVLAWDPVRACEVASLPTGSSMAALFSVPGKCLITTSERGVLQWPISSQEVGPVFGTPKTIVSEAVGHAAMTRDGQTLYVLDEKGGLLVLDLATGREVRRIPVPAAAGRVAVSPDGRWVTCGGGFHPRVSVLDARTYETVAELRLGRLVASTFGPHGKWLVTAGEQQVRLWEVGTWREQAAVERGPEAPYHRGSVAFSPSGQMIAMAATSSTVRLARVPSLDELATLEAPEEEIISWISFSPDGRQLAVGCEGHKVHIWELDLIRRGLRKLNLDWTD